MSIYLVSFSVFIPYKGAPISKQIAPDQDFNASTAIFLNGQVFDRNCQPIPNVIVDVWYAGGNPGNYIIFHILIRLIQSTSCFLRSAVLTKNSYVFSYKKVLVRKLFLRGLT